VTITGRGRTALGELRQAVAEYNRGVLSPLTEAERRLLAGTLGKLYAQAAGGQPPPPGREPAAGGAQRP
jgi:hypothetical protein